MDEKINEWKKLTNDITENWIKEYFELQVGDTPEYYWIADDVGSIFETCDMFFNFSNVLDCYKYNISKEKLFLWYDYCLEKQFVSISLAKFILSPEERAKKEKESLEKTKENLTFAHELFNKKLEKYESKSNKQR